MLETRRRRRAQRDERLAHVQTPARLARRRRCPVRAGRQNSYTTNLLPETRARLKRVHVELVRLADGIECTVPEWVLVEAIVGSALEDPDHVVTLVRELVCGASAEV